jgi:hypothetical protein
MLLYGGVDMAMDGEPSEYTDYCLRYLPLHLHQADHKSRLYTLARDSKFTSHQRERFPKEPEVSMSAQRTAITAAADVEDQPGIAEFCLRHLITLMEARSESPLAVARHGNLERAWRLSDYADADSRSLWHLIIAWFLRATGERGGGAATLDRLLASSFSIIHPGRFANQQNWKNTMTLFLLEVTGHHDRERALKLANKLIPSYQVSTLLESLARGREIESEETWRGSGERAEIMSRAFRQAAEGRIKNARKVLHEIPFDGYGFRMGAYIKVMRRLLAINQEPDACLLASSALRPVGDYEQVESSRLQALADIGCYTVLGGSNHEGKSFLKIAQEQAKAISNTLLKFQACRKVACGWARLGDLERARKSVLQIMNEDDQQAQAEIYVNIAGIAAEIGNVKAAMAMLDEIPEPFWFKSYRNEAIAAISNSLARLGEHEFALSVANTITITNFVSDVESESWAEHAEAFGPIAIAQAAAGDLNGALATFRELSKPKSVTEAGPAERYSEQLYWAAEAVLLSCYEKGLVKEGGEIVSLLTFYGFADSRDLAHLETALTHARSREGGLAITRAASIKDEYWKSAALIKVADILARTACDISLIRRAVNLSLNSSEKVDRFGLRLALLQRLGGLLQRSSTPSLQNKAVRALASLTGMHLENPEVALSSVLPLSVNMVGVKLSAGIFVQAAHWAQPTYDLCALFAKLSSSTTHIGELVCTLRWAHSEENF